MKKDYVAKPADPKHISMIRQRIEHVALIRNLQVDQQLGLVLSKEDFLKARQAILDEYGVQIEAIDTIRDIAYILQMRFG